MSVTQLTCPLRNARSRVSAPSQADIWVSANPVEPTGSLVRVIVQPPPSVSGLMQQADGGRAAARRMVGWMKRLHEAAVMLSR